MKAACVVAGAVAALVVTSVGTTATQGSAIAVRAPAPYTNCTTFNRKYPHGVGKAKARDKTTGTPVTTFKRSTKLYNLAMSKNSGLDRDKDGVACEQA